METDVTLARVLRERAEDLSARTVTAACTGSFWDERFGERGRRYIAADAHHHVDHLATAVSFGLPSIMAGYARWLQGILTSRGMCSRHLEEHFSSLAGAILSEKIPNGERAVAHLQGGIDALLYDPGAARAVQDVAGTLADLALNRIVTEHPHWFQGQTGIQRERLRADVSYLLSYLADAVALGKPTVFSDYLIWIAGYHVRRGRQPSYLDGLITALNAALEELPADARGVSRDIVAVARAQVSR